MFQHLFVSKLKHALAMRSFAVHRYIVNRSGREGDAALEEADGAEGRTGDELQDTPEKHTRILHASLDSTVDCTCCCGSVWTGESFSLSLVLVGY